MAPFPTDAPTPIGRSPLFQATMTAVSRIAPLARPVLLVGERGTGKELIAARLHYLSPRWNQPFLKLNCGGLTDSLLEAELFGHEAGAFTGAQRRRLGRFELAHHGTLFLDEIANAPMTVQETILRVVEYGSFERVGGSETVEVDVRLVAATNEDLPSLAAAGRFRADLLDRLAFDVLTLPPLRERPEDIEILAEHMALGMAQELRRDVFPGFTQRAMTALLSHPWPGNVRELKNVVERAVYRTEPDRKVDDIILDPFSSPWRPLAAAPASADTSGPKGAYDFVSHINAVEKLLLSQALATNGHHQKRTAAFLNMTYHQLRNQLLKHGLIGGDKPAPSPGDD
ncbi:MAG TPA: phage shock protein operon transcriptional activator [Telmatospirillum sp.]|nr:phage shock protein operon transcriptional activator [Telmatospirillum sp.]